MLTLQSLAVQMGGDPEAFLKKDGQIIGSERVIPEIGITVTGNGSSPGLVRDGIQVEIHPYPTTSSQSVVYYLANCRAHLIRTAKAHGAEVCWDGMIEVSRKELLSLSKESQILGCKPSFNYYGMKPVEVDPIKYRKRSASGHIHLSVIKDLIDERLRLIPIMDVIVGNTCVLLDRDPMQVERRKLYGRAGEYRLPDYGVEYRTLSNFWLRHPALVDLVYQLAQDAYNIFFTTLMGNKQEDLEAELLGGVDFKKMVKGIQTNNAEMALHTFEAYQGFIKKVTPTPYVGSPIQPHQKDAFLRLVKRVQTEGLEAVFPEKECEASWQIVTKGYSSQAWWYEAIARF